MPQFSVIIPLYNKENFIEKTLQSVLQQSVTDFEIIIINDGSTDSSETIVLKQTDSRIRYYSKPNEGVSLARNFGIEKANGTYIAFLDADDYWYPDFLETFLQTVLQFPEQLVFAATKEIQTAHNTFPAGYTFKKSDNPQLLNYFESSKKESTLWTSCAVFHKSVFDRVGVFDPAIQIGEDTDMWIRVGLEFPIVFYPKVLARYNYDPESVSRATSYIMPESTFLKYAKAEKDNAGLHQFLDLNRFTVAIKYKLLGNTEAFKKYTKEIDSKNLNLKKRILLTLPAFLLFHLIELKQFLANNGFGNSVFR